jgi:large subunit ribosomal protein L32e
MARVKFLKQEHKRYKRVAHDPSWRKPRGHHSKMREHRKGNPRVVDAGFGKDVTLRGLHPTGLAEVIVCRVTELSLVEKKTQGVRIGGKLSQRNKVLITEAAKKMGLTVFNPAKAKPKKPKAPKTENKAEPKTESAAPAAEEKKSEVKK